MWGLSPSDNNSQIDAYKAAQGVTNPCAGTEGSGPAAIDIVIAGQPFNGYPTYCIVCPDKSMFFDACYPPSVSCLEGVISSCPVLTPTANFSSDETEICQYNEINFMDMSSGSVTSWNWTFEGGDPATSTEQNPTVTYNESGTYDVQLEVSDGTVNNTLLVEEYIDVNVAPPVMLNPFGDVCQNWPAFELTGGSPTGGTYSGPGVDNGWFDPAIAGLGTHAIMYTYTASNDCSNSTEQDILVDPCTGIEDVENKILHLYPNPADGQFTVVVNHVGNVEIQISNILGKIVYSDESFSQGRIESRINLRHIDRGIYFVTLRTSNNTFTQKLQLID